jgi:hypothetical protein
LAPFRIPKETGRNTVKLSLLIASLSMNKLKNSFPFSIDSVCCKKYGICGEYYSKDITFYENVNKYINKGNI